MGVPSDTVRCSCETTLSPDAVRVSCHGVCRCLSGCSGLTLHASPGGAPGPRGRIRRYGRCWRHNPLSLHWLSISDPDRLLIWTIAKSEALYTAYSRFLFGLSLSAPVCLSVVLFGENHVAPSLSWLCFFRILESPIVLVGMGISRFAARFDRAKRLTSYALARRRADPRSSCCLLHWCGFHP